MRCALCVHNAVINAEKPLCKEHFIEHFEEKVLKTIRDCKLIEPNDRIVVAASGGKDSTALLHIINKEYGNVTALAIDEGIPDYRDATLADLQRFCNQNSIPLEIYSYKEEFGFTLHEAIELKNLVPCRSCGILRRYLLNKMSSRFTKIATGHNMDDELQSIMMNMLNSNIELMARGGPITGVIEDGMFTKKIKPLISCTEKEVAAYAVIKGFDIKFTECPNAKTSFRAEVRDLLNGMESRNPGLKRTLMQRFLAMLPKLKKAYKEKATSLKHCKKCQQPSEHEICAACGTVEMIRA